MVDASLFNYSSAQMAEAGNYADWTFSLFEQFVRGNVLEVGCGVGIFTKLITDRCEFEQLMSIDVSADAIAYCRSHLEHPALEFQCVSVQKVQGEFDAVICMNVLEHIEDDRAALGHMLSLLKPGGTLFLLVPAHQTLFTPWDELTGHFRRYNKRKMQRLISEAANGFSFRLTQFYFNTIGALGYFFVYGVLRKIPRRSVVSEIGWFDKWIVPVMKRLEGKSMPFGISLVSIITKEQ